MDEKELLNSMNEIKDEYIEDAATVIGEVPAECANEKSGAGSKSGGKKKSGFSWKGWAAAIAAVLAICIGIGSFTSGIRMGATSSYDMAEAEAGYGYSNGYAYSDAMTVAEEAYDYEADAALEHKSEGSMSEDLGTAASNVTKSESKLIKRAYLTVQTLDFDSSETALYALVESAGGYFESKYVDNGSINYSDYKYAEYTVRIPAEKYDEFLSAVGNNCHISSLNESVEDIGEEYFDVENRLRTLNTKLDRLETLLAEAKDMSDIIDLEAEISNTEYEIDSYTSTLNRYDSLVGYSTIQITLEKVSRVDDGIEQNNSYFARLWRSLKNGLENFVDSLGDIINWAAYNLVGIIIIVVAIIIIRKNHLLTKFLNLFRRK